MFILTEIRYKILRNKKRSILIIFISALLVACMAFYLGNIQSNKDALTNLSTSIPVKVWVVNRTGLSRERLNISEKHFDRLKSANVDNILTISRAAGNLSNALRSEQVFLGGDTAIVGANDIKAVSGLSEESITFSNSWDSSFISGDKAVCIVDENYAKGHSLTIGDSISLPIYGVRYAPFGSEYIPIGDVALEIIGTYKGGSNDGFSPPTVCAPIDWLKAVTKKAGINFYYESMSATLSNPMKLNEFKAELPKLEFYQVQREAQNGVTGDAIIVEDELFVKTATELSASLKVFQELLIPFFILVIGLITLVTFLILRSSLRDIAIGVSLGMSKLHIGFAYFVSIVLTDIVGCVVALPIMSYVARLHITDTLMILGIFILCAAIGTALALLLLLRFNAMALLTKVE